MRSGIFPAIGAAFLLGVALTIAQQSGTAAEDQAPWHIANVAKLATARGGSETAEPANAARKYLHIQVKFNVPPEARKKHNFRITDARGDELGELWGWNDVRSLVIFEGSWGSLEGLYLDANGHREPLFARAKVVPRVVGTEPVRQTDPARVATRPRNYVTPRVGTRVLTRPPVVVGPRYVRGGPDVIVHDNNNIVHRGGPDVIVHRGGPDVIHDGGVKHVYEDGPDVVIDDDRGVKHVYEDGPDVVIHHRGGNVKHVHEDGPGSGSGSGSGSASGSASGSGPGAGSGSGPGEGPGAGTGEGEGKGSGKCKTCDGTGVCPECDGKGCKACNDTGKCQDCDGSGECKTCDGTGVCPECDGKGCKACNNTGKCPDCAESSGSPESPSKCKDCGGTGVCPKCKGEGCPACGNTGKCPTCSGTGMAPGKGPGCGPGKGPGAGCGPGQICDKCNGTKVCPACLGRGCQACAMTGLCPYCCKPGTGGPGGGPGYGPGGPGGLGGIRTPGMMTPFRPRRPGERQPLELGKMGPLTPMAPPDKLPELIMYVATGEESGPGKVYQMNEHGRVLGCVNLPFTPTGLALHRNNGLVLAVPRDGGKIMYIDESGKQSTLWEKDQNVIHPVDVAVSGDSDTVLVADNIADLLAATTTGGTKPKIYQRMEGQKWAAQDMSVAITQDKHVIYGTNGDKGIFRFAGDNYSANLEPLLPGPGGVAADPKSLLWSATQSPNQMYLFEGDQLVKKLRLPPGKSHYRNGLLSFAPSSNMVVAARESDKTDGEVWFLQYRLKDEEAASEGKEGSEREEYLKAWDNQKTEIRSLYPWTRETMTDFVVGPRMRWERNSASEYKSTY